MHKNIITRGGMKVMHKNIITRGGMEVMPPIS
jgi:hypothetical protein